MHCPSAGGGESGNGIAHVAFRHVAVRKSSALALGQPAYRNCQPAMPRLCRTASTARAAQQGNRPHSLGSSRRTVPVATLTAAAGTLQTASGASAAKRLYQHISYRQHDRADRKGDKPLAFREFLNLRQHIKEFAP